MITYTTEDFVRRAIGRLLHDKYRGGGSCAPGASSG